MAKINKTWQILENEVKIKPREGNIRRLYSSELPLYVNLGIYLKSSTHFLAFEVAEEHLTNYKSLPRIKGLSTNRVKFGDEKNNAISLVLAATSNAYNDSFDILCEDLIDYAKTQSQSSLVVSLADRLGMWKKFFSEIPCEILSEERQIGLAGELNFIYKSLESGIDKSLLINSWKGYDHSSKDFIFSNVICIEVKASKSAKSVKVSSELQLDETDYEKCILYFCHFMFSNEADISLNILVDKIREILSDIPNAIKVFDEGLLQYGYFDLHRDYYNRCFYLKNESCFSIKGDFPRVRKIDLREGVSSIRYVIDLTIAKNYEKPFSEVIHLIKENRKNG